MKAYGVRSFSGYHTAVGSNLELSSLLRISNFAIHARNKLSFNFLTRCSRSALSVKCAIRFRPCIDIHKEFEMFQGKVKQIVGSTLQDLKDGGSDLVTNFESDKSASEFAKLYKMDGLTSGHVIMLGADALSRTAAVEALRAYPGGLQVGGGINLDNALSYLDEGASHVIVTSYVFNNGHMDLQRLKSLVHMIGKQRLGIDEELVALLGKHSQIPVTYAGGVTTMEDLERIRVAGSGHVDVTVGSALDVFGGDLAYKDVVAWHKEQESVVV